MLRRATPRVDLQYHIGVPDPHDLDRPRYPLSGLHTTPEDRFYNANPIVRSNPGSSRESSTEPMDTDEAQQITDRLMQGYAGLDLWGVYPHHCQLQFTFNDHR